MMRPKISQGELRVTSNRRLTRRRFGAAALAGATLSSAPLPLRYGLAQSGGNLKVALLLPTSGALALIGQACKRGADIANEVLAEAGVAARLEIVNYDTETKVDVARTQAEKAVEAGVHVLCGAFDSGQTIAIAQVAERKGVPLIVNIAAAPPITESGYKFIVRNFPTAPQLLGSGFEMQKEIFKASGVTPKSAVILCLNDTIGATFVGAIKANFAKFGMPYELVDIITYDAAVKDLSVEVAKAKSTRAELLMPICKLNDGKLMFQELVKQRWEPMIINPGGPATYEQDFIKPLGKYAEFAVSMVPWVDPKAPMTKLLEKHHTAKFPGAQFDLDAGFTFEAMLIAAHAWLAAKSTKPDALMQALRTIKIKDHVIIGGPIEFDAKGQNPNIQIAALENINRAPRVVLPAASAEGQLVFPPPGWNDKRRT
jgi:branched-chain amino acid transport system substrate-binding protein